MIRDSPVIPVVHSHDYIPVTFHLACPVNSKQMVLTPKFFKILHDSKIACFARDLARVGKPDLTGYRAYLLEFTSYRDPRRRREWSAILEMTRARVSDTRGRTPAVRLARGLDRPPVFALTIL